MRVCLVSPYALGAVSGISTFLLDLAAELRLRGHSASFIGPRGPAVRTDVEVTEVPLPPRGRTLALARGSASALRRLARDVDVVHVQQAHPQTWAIARAARGLRIPVVATLHVRPAAGGRLLRRVADRAAERGLLAKADAVVHVSEHTRKAFGGRGVVIHNGIGRHVLEAARSGRGASREGRGAGDRFRFVFAGRRSHDKGYPDLLAAAGRLRKRGRRFVLEAVGPASPGTGTDIRKAERALGDAFRDHGAVEREDWFRIAAGAEAFVLPSHLEGLPMALLEAMAFSLGIIATPVGGVPEAVGPAEAFLVPPRDPGAIDHAMASFLDDPEGCRALGRAARLRVEHGFTMERCARRYEEIYRGVLEG